MITTKDVHDTLKRISNPQTRLTVMVEHSLNDDAFAYLKELASTLVPVFEPVYSASDLGLFASKDRGNERRMSSMQLFLFAPDTDFSHGTPRKQAVVHLDCPGFFKTLGYGPLLFEAFAKPILRRFLDVVPVGPRMHWAAEGMWQTAEHCLDSEKNAPLLRRAEIWYREFQLLDENLFGIRRTLRPSCEQGHGINGPGNRRLVARELVPVVNRLGVLRAPKKEVCSVLLRALEHKAKIGTWQDVLALSTALEQLEETPALIEQQVRQYLGRRVEEENVFTLAGRFVALKGHYTLTREDLDIFRGKLAAELAAGRIGYVYSWLETYKDELPGVVEGQELQEKVADLAPAAVCLARQNEEFGIAALLCVMFGVTSELSELLRMVQDAHVLGRWRDLDLSGVAPARSLLPLN